MTRTRRPMRVPTRRTLTTATIGIVLVSLGVLAGEGPAIGDQKVATTLAYTCQFPSGAQQVSLQVNATYPESGAIGQPIAPANVSVAMDVPQAAVADLIKIGAAAVQAYGDLSVVVKQNSTSSIASWANLVAKQTAVPPTGDLNLTMSGTVPASIETDSGEVSFSADKFSVAFGGQDANGAATTPPVVPVSCTINPDQTAPLATVDIPVSPAAPPSAGTTAPPATGTSKTLVHKHDDGPPALPTDPACQPVGGDGFSNPGDGSQVNAQLASRTNLDKLNESARATGSITLTNIEAYFEVRDDGTFYSVVCYTGQMDLAPSTATVLGFGFMPITTTLAFTQDPDTTDDPMLVDASDDSAYADGRPAGHASGKVTISVVSASINGTPLNVGPNCRTPLVPLVLSNIADYDGSGNEVYPYNGAGGGYMQGSIDIPPFTGCGVEDNLDALLSAPVSGPDHLVRVCQGSTQSPPPPMSWANNNCDAP